MGLWTLTRKHLDVETDGKLYKKTYIYFTKDTKALRYGAISTFDIKTTNLFMTRVKPVIHRDAIKVFTFHCLRDDMGINVC